MQSITSKRKFRKDDAPFVAMIVLVMILFALDSQINRFNKMIQLENQLKNYEYFISHPSIISNLKDNATN